MSVAFCMLSCQKPIVLGILAQKKVPMSNLIVNMERNF